MASRMDKYFNIETMTDKRSHRNRILYEFLEANNPKTMAALDKEIEARIAKLERLLSGYETYTSFKNENLNKYNIDYPLKKETVSPEQNIKNLMDNISAANQLKNNNKNFYNNDQYKKNIESLFKKEETNSIKKDNYYSKNKVDEKEKRRKFNLRLKRVIGLIFLINCLIIILLIYQSIH